MSASFQGMPYGQPAFVVYRERTRTWPGPADEESFYGDLGILDDYYAPDRFELPLGVLEPGSARALLAMQMPQVMLPPPGLRPGQPTPSRARCACISILTVLGTGAVASLIAWKMLQKAPD